MKRGDEFHQNRKAKLVISNTVLLLSCRLVTRLLSEKSQSMQPNQDLSPTDLLKHVSSFRIEGDMWHVQI